MFELLAIGLVVVVGLAVLSALFGVLAFALWLVLLPFRLLGFAFKALGALLLLPIVLVGGLVLAVVVGIPLLLAAVLPAVPLVLLVWAIWWVFHRGTRSAAPAR